ILGGARAADVLAVTDPLGVAAATGSCSMVGMAGLTFGGGYGPALGRLGVWVGNIIAAAGGLCDGRGGVCAGEEGRGAVVALWGGVGNFGVVTAMRHRLHDLPSVCSGMLVYPFSEAGAVLARCAEVISMLGDELTVQLAFVAGPDGAPVVLVVPTWCGLPEE